MEDTAGPSQSSSLGRRRVVIAVVAGVAVFVAVAVAIWAFNSMDDNETAAPSSGSPSGVEGGVEVPGAAAEIVTVPELRRIAGSSTRPIYWAGVRPDSRIEYTQTGDGSTYVRYLTGSAEAGDAGAGYVVVATYAQPDAYRRVSQTAQDQNLAATTLPGGGLAVTKPNRPQNIYVAFRGLPYQIEVYAPTAAEARQVVFSGAVVPVA